MSADHREAIKLRLQLEGFSAEFYERSGQLISVTAEDLLATFVLKGALDEELFKSTIGRLIERAKATVPNGRPRKVRVFGEMVSQLRNSDMVATTRLEELWGEVIKDHSVAWLCTYALHNADDQLPDHLIAIHSHNIQREIAVP